MKYLLFSVLLVCLTTFSVRADILPERPAAPLDNPTTAAKVELGKKLYFDGRLSKDGTVSCNTCHNAAGSGVDGLQFSKGVQGKLGGRNSPTVLNAAFLSVQFWDGRAASLEEQAKGPMINPVEMAMENHDAVVARLKTIPGYVSEFKKVFAKGKEDALNIDNVAKAIAAFERTLVTPNAPYDRYMKGDKKALSASAVRGLKLTQTVGCVSCHSGVNFAGPALPMGTGFYQKFPMIPGSEYEKKYDLTKDLGRYEVTKSDSDKNLFRVPTWRNIELTAPYFHNGSVVSLDEAVRVMAKTQLNRVLSEAEVSDIVAFLKSLTGKRAAMKPPVLPKG